MNNAKLMELAASAGLDCGKRIYSERLNGDVTEELDTFADLLIEEICNEIIKIGYRKSEFTEPKQLSPTELVSAIRYKFGLTSKLATVTSRE